MQASSDIFLGWTKGLQDDRFYYWRQLRDMKASAAVETMNPFGMTFYARMCGWTLARAHARSGDPVAIAQYLGRDDSLDQAINTFATEYADQNSRDYEAFVTAVEDGRLDAVHEV
jgi:predicted alpha/beta hydrolase